MNAAIDNDIRSADLVTRGVDRLFPRCLETPLAHKRGGASEFVKR